MRGGVILKHFSARDVVSRWDVLEVHRRATSLAAARFLDSLLDRTPFPIKALQVDGGSEFAAEFEEACLQKDLPLFVLPPRSHSKLQRPRERSNRTHNEEFYEVQAESYQVPGEHDTLLRHSLVSEAWTYWSDSRRGRRFKRVGVSALRA